MAEHRVEMDLLARGFEVYLPSHRFQSCDLVYFDGERWVRVEVKSTKLDASGMPACDLSRHVWKFDVLAVVLPGGEIQYRPYFEMRERISESNDNCGNRAGILMQAVENKK
jgi:hypothetical protein